MSTENQAKLFDRASHSSRTISIYQLIGAYLVDVYYNNLYIEAVKIKTNGRVPSITEGYKAAICAFLGSIDNKSKGMYKAENYNMLLDGINQYFTIWTSYNTLTLSECIDKIVREFVPEDYYKSLNKDQKRNILRMVLINVIREFTKVVLTDYIGPIIDNHEEQANTDVLKERLVDIFILEREKMFHKFLDSNNPEGEKVDKKFAEKMRADIKKLHEERNNTLRVINDIGKELEIRKDQLAKVLTKYRKLELTHKALQAEHEADKDKIADLEQQLSMSTQDNFSFNQNSSYNRTGNQNSSHDRMGGGSSRGSGQNSSYGQNSSNLRPSMPAIGDILASTSKSKQSQSDQSNSAIKFNLDAMSDLDDMDEQDNYDNQNTSATRDNHNYSNTSDKQDISNNTNIDTYDNADENDENYKMHMGNVLDSHITNAKTKYGGSVAASNNANTNTNGSNYNANTTNDEEYDDNASDEEIDEVTAPASNKTNNLNKKNTNSTAMTSNTYNQNTANGLVVNKANKLNNNTTGMTSNTSTASKTKIEQSTNSNVVVEGKAKQIAQSKQTPAPKQAAKTIPLKKPVVLKSTQSVKAPNRTETKINKSIQQTSAQGKTTSNKKDNSKDDSDEDNANDSDEETDDIFKKVGGKDKNTNDTKKTDDIDAIATTTSAISSTTGIASQSNATEQAKDKFNSTSDKSGAISDKKPIASLSQKIVSGNVDDINNSGISSSLFNGSSALKLNMGTAAKLSDIY